MESTIKKNNLHSLSKKSLLLLFAGLSFNAIQAQEVPDALRYSQSNLTGTARFRAMSGAFGALGGDLSSLSVNPAGSAVFSGIQLNITAGSLNTKNKSNYFGTNTSENTSSFDLNQLGAVFVFKDFSQKSGWKKIAVAINYENTANFDDTRYIAGTNPTSSATGYFASVANSIRVPVSVLSDSYYQNLSLREQIAFLGYQGYLINDVTDGLTSIYAPNVTGGNFYQDSYTETSGYNGKVAFNAAAEYNDRFYFGLNINTHFTDYTKVTNFYEQNNNSQTQGVRLFYYDTDLHTYGNGFSFQLGTIAKITNGLRAGLAYESPTWYTLNDEMIQTVYSTGFNFNGNPALSSVYPDSEYLMVYAPYKLKTPGKWTGSLAYVFGKTGILSIDYSLKDYGATRYRPNDSYFNPINQAMDNSLAVAGGLRIGGEYRIQKWSLRGGFRNDESPYKNKNIMGDLTGYSGGFGYNFGKTKLDLAYAYAQRKSAENLFSQGFNGAPNIKTINNDVTLSVLIDF